MFHRCVSPAVPLFGATGQRSRYIFLFPHILTSVCSWAVFLRSIFLCDCSLPTQWFIHCFLLQCIAVFIANGTFTHRDPWGMAPGRCILHGLYQSPTIWEGRRFQQQPYISPRVDHRHYMDSRKGGRASIRNALPIEWHAIYARLRIHHPKRHQQNKLYLACGNEQKPYILQLVLHVYFRRGFNERRRKQPLLQHLL